MTEPGTPLPEAMHKARKMLQAAQQFYEAGERCSLMDEAAGKGWLPYPGAVNYAFAAELALKGLIRVHMKEDARGHDLEKLFNRLPSEVQDVLRGPGTSSVVFAERLHEDRLTFETWRYAYEKGEVSVSLTFLPRLASASMQLLASAVRRLLPITA